MRLFNKNKEQDERVVNLKNKIYKEMYTLIMVISVISAGIKAFVFQQPASTEFFIIFGSGVYYLYRSVQLGIFSSEVDMYEQNSKQSFNQRSLIWSLVFGVGIAVVMGLNSAVQYADGTGERIEYFLTVSFGTLMIYLPFSIIVFVVGSHVAKRKSDEAVDKLLDDEDNPGDDDEKH